jgi:hypothetical protein
VLVSPKIGPVHLGRDAYVYVRQSTLTQLREHTESLIRQYELRERAVALGWDAHQVRVIDADLGRSGAEATAREGFKDLVADVGLGRVGIVLSIDVSRLARNDSDWYQQLDLRGVTDTLITRPISTTGWCSACLTGFWRPPRLGPAFRRARSDAGRWGALEAAPDSRESRPMCMVMSTARIGSPQVSQTTSVCVSLAHVSWWKVTGGPDSPDSEVSPQRLFASLSIQLLLASR